jgi:hypothetical protein
MTVIESTVQQNSFIIKTVNFVVVKVHLYENKIWFYNKIFVLECIFCYTDNSYYTYIIQVMYIEYYQNNLFYI